MHVIFRKVDEKRYLIGLRRDDPHDTGPDVPPRIGPGGGPVPHDLVHFAIEEVLGIRLGIFGQLAAGGDCDGFFFPAPEDRKKLADARRNKRISEAGRSDAVRSELIAALVGHDGTVRHKPELLSDDEHRRVSSRIADLIGHWEQTGHGEDLVLHWPSRKVRL
ncbi:hypothetical protein [Nocardioides cavernaquae]|uniref:Uncharacterized protein n=1 Tax=Nocardioides cavernaquae TaxID=2321396 RepID=A0A3A5HDX0_9ACTN|nr:hypothetical protein [Nocardioides cavernaquae]RJS46234.1 hypothetical protein D4739_08430 [Nocardioides cavernaquae]